MPNLPPYLFIGGTSEPGGLHVHTADLAIATAAAGHSVTILCPSIDHFTPLFTGTPVRVHPIPPRAPDQSEWHYWRHHLAPHSSARAVFVRGMLGESTIMDLVAIRAATRRLYTLDHREPEMPGVTPRNLLRHGRAMRLLVHRAITVSPEITRHAREKLRLPPRLLATCPNWPDPAFQPVTPDQRDAAKLALGLSPSEYLIGYHGRLAPEKRIPALVEAFATLRHPTPLRLLLIGDGWKRNEIQALVNARNLHASVTFTGWHPNPRDALAALDLSVLPSLSEGFPLGLLEAMAMAKPCLAHPMPSTRLIIQPHHNGHLADLSTPQTFSAALQNLLDLPPPQRQTLGQNAAHTVTTTYARSQRLPAVLQALDIHPPHPLPTQPRHLVFAR